MHHLSDDDIIDMVLQGNSKAFAVLIERYQHFVFTLTHKFISNREDAEEIAQDVFVKAYQALSQYNKQSKFSTWLYSICRNICFSQLRKIKLSVTQEVDDKATHNEVVQQTEQKSKKAVIQHALKELEEDDAAIITLFYLHEQTIDEIATILNISKSNVKVKLYRARKKLKLVIEKKFKNELTG